MAHRRWRGPGTRRFWQRVRPGRCRSVATIPWTTRLTFLAIAVLCGGTTLVTGTHTASSRVLAQRGSVTPNRGWYKRDSTSCIQRARGGWPLPSQWRLLAQYWLDVPAPDAAHSVTNLRARLWGTRSVAHSSHGSGAGIHVQLGFDSTQRSELSRHVRGDGIGGSLGCAIQPAMNGPQSSGQ